MNRDETLKLWDQAFDAESDHPGKGREIWNSWANQMLQEKAKLVRNKEWSLSRSTTRRRMPDGGEIEVSSLDSEKTRDWLDRARADLSNYDFRDTTIMADFMFPHDVAFGGSTFHKFTVFQNAKFFGDANFNDVKFKNFLNLRNTEFYGNLNFGSQTIFEDAALFEDAKFHSQAQLAGLIFERDALFYRCLFAGRTNIGGTVFRDEAGFSNSVFAGECIFARAEFRKTASFSNARFYGISRFEQSRFIGPANFSKSHFFSSANFHSIQCENSFSLADAKFSSAPDFIQANFLEVPRLDDISIQDPLQKRGWRFHKLEPRPAEFSEWKVAKDENEQARFRALKKLAISAHDHEQEIAFFANELRARRFWHSWPCGKKAGNFWLGLFYEVFSDFGRSFLRPSLWWLCNLVLFALILMFFRHSNPTSNTWNSYLPAEVYLAFINSLPGLGYLRSQNKELAFSYLFGKQNQAIFPFLDIVFVLHGLIQALFIFFFLLAVRNNFKIK